MLNNLIKKYKKNDITELVYCLSYAGKFLIVKGKTLTGSLIIINNTFNQYVEGKDRFKGHLYRHLYDHYMSTPDSRFRIRVLAKSYKGHTHYYLLKREQMELDRHRYNPLCLNNVTEAYIPLYNDTTDMFGWLDKAAVMNFKRYLTSKERQAYIKRYSTKPVREPASYGL